MPADVRKAYGLPGNVYRLILGYAQFVVGGAPNSLCT
jgi:hypothetical protein